METWVMAFGACAALWAAGAAFGAGDNGTGDDALLKLPKGARRIDGRVKEIDLNLMKIAVEVEVDPAKPAEIVIFQMTADTRVRERENAKSVKDLRNGNPVLVWYLAAEKKTDPPKAVFIRILEGSRNYGPGRRPR